MLYWKYKNNVLLIYMKQTIYDAFVTNDCINFCVIEVGCGCSERWMVV